MATFALLAGTLTLGLIYHLRSLNLINAGFGLELIPEPLGTPPSFKGEHNGASTAKQLHLVAQTLQHPSAPTAHPTLTLFSLTFAIPIIWRTIRR